jgi:NAD(P)-dependent dehydrogenase (short-subunit alcohol dehydrogenase family)
VLLVQALLPALRQRSEQADIVSMISACGIPHFTDSIAHPAFFASKHGLSGFTQTSRTSWRLKTSASPAVSRRILN